MDNIYQISYLGFLITSFSSYKKVVTYKLLTRPRLDEINTQLLTLPEKFQISYLKYFSVFLLFVLNTKHTFNVTLEACFETDRNGVIENLLLPSLLVLLLQEPYLA